jgi:alkylation response protein AidB-like acyl-CoA dehydrogenase
MILEHSEDLQAFRHAVRAWLEQASPKDWRQTIAMGDANEFAEFQRWWMRERAKVGLAIAHWPSEFGGADLSLAHQIIIAEENARADAPPVPAFIVALNHIPVTLLAWGTDDQKRRYLPTIAQGSIWCQGFSEPNSGSDLASLKTRAVRDGDHYVVNGQKIWSSSSMHADYCILLTRTDFESRKQAGITYFVLDMHAPGVEVRPIRQATGHAEFGEIFLEDVRIPVEDRVGDENQGWTVAQSTLAAERGVLAFEGLERQRYQVEAFHRSAVEADADWLKDDQLRREFMVLFSELQAGRRLVRKLLREAEEQHGRFSMTPNIVKITNTILRKRMGDFMVRVAGDQGQVFIGGSEEDGDNPMMEYVSAFGGVIAAGTNEIQRNLIAERGLNLPRA